MDITEVNETISMEITVKDCIHRNNETGWSVLKVLDSDGQMQIVVGCFHNLTENEHLLVKGEWANHNKFGLQFKANTYEIIMPTDEQQWKEYLASGVIKGVRERTAEKIVDYFGAEIGRVLEEEPERLAQVRGISERKAVLIGQRIKENKEMRNLMIFLKQYGITPAYAFKIYDTYEGEVYKVLRENPYQIAKDVRGIGFKKADEIAMAGGIAKDSPYRIASGIDYILDEAQAQGHVYLPYDEVITNTEELLCVDAKEELVEKINRKEVIKTERNGQTVVYNKLCYYTETGIAEKLATLNAPQEVPDRELILTIEKQFGITLDVTQRQAVETILKSGVGILTGGPGTGKTQTTKVLVEYFRRKHIEVALAAPTGRAAKRMTEVIGKQSKTIHRLLEVSGAEGGGSKFLKNEEEPLTQDVIIIDESSMIDQFLMYSLLKAIKPPTRLILVGDINQLPSVGAGNVLRDMIDSGCFSVGRLTKIFRQSEDSTIVTNAHTVINGEKITLKNSTDFYFIRTQEKETTIENVKIMVKDRIPRKMNIKPSEIQVLTQIKSRQCGVENLNIELQESLNPAEAGKAECLINQTVFRCGDKVMQLKNNYKKEVLRNGRKELGVFNGDTGYIKKIDNDEEYITIEFDDQGTAVYTFKEMRDVELAYAITIHKSQGSEYPCVVIPMQDFIPMLSGRNLLYTALTRAKKMVILIGQEKFFHLMCKNEIESVRNTGLKELLVSGC